MQAIESFQMTNSGGTRVPDRQSSRAIAPGGTWQARKKTIPKAKRTIIIPEEIKRGVLVA